MTPLEKDIEKKLRLMVERHGGLCLKWVCPGWSGVPDRLILLPGGRIIFAELKTKGGRMSHLQKWWRDKLQDMGFWAVVIWNEDNINTLELVIADLLGGGGRGG